MFGSKIFSPAKLLMSIYSKEFLATNLAFLEFAYFFIGRNKTNHRSHRQQINHMILPDESNFTRVLENVLQLTFKIAHFSGSVNTAADFLSRLELKVTEKIRLKIREDI